MSNEWQHGLFGCFDNCFICVVTYFVPCYTYGKVAEAAGDSCLLCGLVFFVPIANIFFGATTRGKIREMKGIEGSLLKDVLMIWCCGCCSLIQEAQEVNCIGSQSMARE